MILQQLGSDERCLAVVIGYLIDVDEHTLSVKGEKGNCAMVRFSDCEFDYELRWDELGVLPAVLTGREFEDIFTLISPQGTIFAIGDASATTEHV
jgi:hypothetical protein